MSGDDSFFVDGLGQTLSLARKEMREHVEQVVAQATAEVGKEYEAKLAAKTAALTSTFDKRIAELERRASTAMGRMSMAPTWEKDTAALEGELCTRDGSLWQARQTTGQAPGGPHWTCVARGADTVASPTPNLPEPDRGNEMKALRAEFASRFEKASGDLVDLETRITCLQAIDREQLVRIEDRVGQIRAEAREEVKHGLGEQEGAFEVKIAASERWIEAAEARAQRLEAELSELRGEARVSTAKTTDVLRRCEADVVKADKAVEAVEARCAGKFATMERRIEASEARAQKLEAELVGLQVQARDSAVKIIDDMRRCEADVIKADKAVAAVEERFQAKIGEMAERLAATAGELAMVKNWKPESVTYAREIVCCGGSSFQAMRDTATRPGSSDDWIQVARAGKDGANARSIVMRGVFDIHATYQALDVVEFQGELYIATSTDPGTCPSGGWQRFSGGRGEEGEQGQRGPMGPKGDQGPPAPDNR